MSYPHSPGHTSGSDTSLAAAQHVTQKASGECEWLEGALAKAGERGLTLDEAHVSMQANGFKMIKNNVSTRLGALCGRNKAFRSKDRRPGVLSDRSQIVYKHKKFWTIFDGPTPTPEQKQSVSLPHFRIWSNEHRAWWNPNRAGYTPRYKLAGLYSYEDALSICINAGCDDIGVPNETMLPATPDMDKWHGG